MKSTWPVLLGLLLLTAPATAQVDLTYTELDGGVTIIGYTGFGPLETLVIPATLDNLPVTGIAADAFAGLDSATNISIPASLSTIGAGAFSDCLSLTAIIVDPQNSFYSATNGVLFDKAQATLVEYPGGLAGNFTIPGTVTAIGIDAFELCEGLTNVTIPSGVTLIGEDAFSDCAGLTNITIPGSVTTIGADAFFGCVNMADITVEATNSFYSSAGGVLCDKTQATLIVCPGGLAGSYAIPASVITIASNAFGECLSLTNVTIPGGVTNIGAGAFFGCSALTAIAVDATNPAYSSASGVLFDKNETTLVEYPGGLAGGYTIPASVTGIGEDAFEKCQNLTSVKIPASVTNIGIGAFQNCSGLATVTMAAGVIGIGLNAFENCSSLASVTIPGSVNAVGIGAFENCYFLASATMDAGVACIESNAFENCYSLGSVTIPASVTNIGQRAFDNCLSLTSVTIPSGVRNIGQEAFAFCSGMTRIAIPASVTSIGNEAFAYCSSLTSVTIPSGIGSVEPYTFYECADLASVTIPASVTNIDTGAFEQCYNLAGITIPTNVGAIGADAFDDCSSLTGITIPASVTQIGYTPFNECSSLTTITVTAGNPSFSSLDGVLFNQNQTLLLEFPGGQTGSYTIPGTVTVIGFWAFENCQGLTNVVIPNSVTGIEEGAFENCSGLLSVTIPESVEHIGDSAFLGCSGLTTMTIPGSVAVIGDNAFSGTGVTNFYFTGNAPLAESSAFDTNNNPIVYYLPGTIHWLGFAGLPTVLWNPVIQTLSGLGVQNNQFDFTITGPDKLVVEVEVSTNLAGPDWTPLRTVTLTNGSFNFTEPLQSNISGRFYGLGLP
jgi:hypothetical protein